MQQSTFDDRMTIYDAEFLRSCNIALVEVQPTFDLTDRLGECTSFLGRGDVRLQLAIFRGYVRRLYDNGELLTHGAVFEALHAISWSPEIREADMRLLNKELLLYKERSHLFAGVDPRDIERFCDTVEVRDDEKLRTPRPYS